MFFLILGLCFSSEVVEEFNKQLMIVSGEDSYYYQEIDIVHEYNSSIPSSYTSVILLNNTLAKTLELHYFEVENSLISRHYMPGYEMTKKYDLEGISSILDQKFHIIAKEVSIFQIKEQLISLTQEYEKLEIKLSEMIIYANGDCYKLYSLNQPGSISFYIWDFGKALALKSSKITMSIVFSFALSVLCTSIGVYLYYNIKKQFPIINP
jgi:hypothetical protein